MAVCLGGSALVLNREDDHTNEAHSSFRDCSRLISFVLVREKLFEANFVPKLPREELRESCIVGQYQTFATLLARRSWWTVSVPSHSFRQALD